VAATQPISRQNGAQHTPTNFTSKIRHKRAKSGKKMQFSPVYASLSKILIIFAIGF
jgi:hypothetical protein